MKACCNMGGLFSRASDHKAKVADPIKSKVKTHGPVGLVFGTELNNHGFM